MSKKKTARRSKPLKNHDFSVLINVKLKVLYFFGVLFGVLVCFLEGVYQLRDSIRCRMMAGKRGLEDSPGVSERKRARVLNKQSKMLAEYRLVVKDEGEGGGRGKLGEEEFKAMKKELAERKRALTQLPRFWVNSSAGATASVFQTEYSSRTPLLLSDFEHLVTYAYGGNALVPPPSRWCSLQKPNRLNNVVIVVVSGIGLSEFVDNEECFGGMMEVFGGGDGTNRAVVEFLSPGWYGSTMEGEIRNWGVIGGKKPYLGCDFSRAKLREQKEETTPEKQEEDDTPNESFQTVLNQLGSVFPISGKVKKKKRSLPPGDSFSRTDLILTLPQLIQENYPLPIPSTALSKFKFEVTSDKYSPVNPQSKMFSIDCEMCVTKSDPQALTRIGIVDEDLVTVYDSLVKPDEEITDYLTRWSGITRDMLVGVETTLGDVQGKIKELVAEYPDCVFVGQSLNCDLKAIRMTHPYVIDTSVIFNLTGVKGRKSSLRNLSWNLIEEEIQAGSIDKRRGIGHCPVEDASAAMKLVKAKLEKGFSFGNALKDSLFLKQSTKLLVDSSYMGNSFKQEKLDKNVLLVSQSDHKPEEEPPADDTQQNGDTQKPHLSTHLKSDSNKSTMKTVSTRIFEYFMSVGFYDMNPTDDMPKSLRKLDKRISKLYNNLGGNSLFIVLCSKDGEKGSYCSDSRRNNGIGFVKVKAGDSGGRRRD